jgi:alpha-tubulin suppressor-like RCC1 family protein
MCWGDNSSGQTAVPEGLASVIEVSAGYLHTCALKEDKTVACWGANGFGQATVPAGLAAVAQISAGTYHTCALKTDLTVVCWGYDGGGLTVPDGLVSVGQVGAGGAHTCVLRTDGTVSCWGDNGFGQATVPDGLASVSQLSADAAHTCALKTDGTVVCWGDDQFGQVSVPNGLNLLGTPQSITFTSSAPVPGLVGSSYSVSATGGDSGNPVVFASSTESVCTVSGSNVTLVAAGTCTISASQAGGGGYQAAHDETQSFLVITPLVVPSPSA